MESRTDAPWKEPTEETGMPTITMATMAAEAMVEATTTRTHQLPILIAVGIIASEAEATNVTAVVAGITIMAAGTEVVSKTITTVETAILITITAVGGSGVGRETALAAHTPSRCHRASETKCSWEVLTMP